MKRILTILMLFIGIGSVTLTMAGKHGQGIDWQSLNLTKQQGIEVQKIRKSYRSRFQSLRNEDLSRERKKQQLLQLREQMVVQVRAILSDEQKVLASEAVAEEMESRINKRLARVMSELVLTSDQENSLKQILSAKINALQEPLLVLEIPDFNDRQQMFDQLDDVFPQLLSSEQLELWQQMKYKRQLHLQSLQKPERSALYLFG